MRSARTRHEDGLTASCSLRQSPDCSGYDTSESAHVPASADNANGAMVMAAMLHDPTAALHAKHAAEQLLNAPAAPE